MKLFRSGDPAPPRATGRRSMRSNAASVRGFSTLEILLVMPVIVILATAGVVSMRQALAREEVDGWARSMTYDISAGRQAAITRRTTVTVTITGTTFTIGAAGVGTIRQATVPADISMTTTCPAGACSFDRRGLPIASGTITVTSASTGRTFTITIESGTGRVSYSEP